MHRTFLMLMFTALMSTALTAANAASFPLRYTDKTGHTIHLNAPARRIVSLAPSHTEIIYALGLGDKLVGVDSYSNYPAAVASKPDIGDLYNVSLEKLVALKPDLVLLYELSAKELQGKLTKLGIPSVVITPESLADVYNAILDIGRMTGAESSAQSVVAGMQRKVNEVKAIVAKAATKPSVFYEVWPDPLYTAGPGSFVHELVLLGGGRNIAEDSSSKWPVFSLEALIARNPDVILTPIALVESITTAKRKTLLASVRAVVSGRIYQVDQDIVNRPGPRLADALLFVAKTIHPELFR